MDDVIKLKDFCDLGKLYDILSHWSKSTGMSAAVVDNYDSSNSKTFGMSGFCKMIHSCEDGLSMCKSTWLDNDNTKCPFGFYDFSIPIQIKDGIRLGTVMAGQTVADKSKINEMLEKVERLGIDREYAKNVINNAVEKSQADVESSYELLKITLEFFFDNSYSIWKANKELKSTPAKQDKVLSHITQILYGFNLTVDLETGKYSLITGSGMEKTIKVYESTNDYKTAHDMNMMILHSDYHERMKNLLSFEALCNYDKFGLVGSLEYPVNYDGTWEWHEINVFIDTDENGKRVANILGRDITEAHEQQEKTKREIKAVAAKDQILSEITKALYGYNIVLNLNTGKYSLITGSGMENSIKLFSSTDDYEYINTFEQNQAVSGYKELVRLFSLAELRKYKNSQGLVGKLEYCVKTEKGLEWREVNAFIGVDEDGNPTANLLGRDVTKDHESHMMKERELRVSAAKNQLLSGVTKMLYGFNITVNLNTGKYTLIIGTGLDDIAAMLSTTDVYEVIYNYFLYTVDEEYKDRGIELLDFDNLKKYSGQIGFVDSQEFLMHEKKGIQWHEINIFCGFDENYEPVVNILGRDITEAKDKADTKAQLKVARAANDAKSQFLSNMSHDIRTPINGIMGMLTIAKSHRDDQALVDDCLNKIDMSSHYLLTLINDILDLNKLESGKTVFVDEPVDINALTKDVYMIIEPLANESGINVSMNYECPKKNYVITSPLHLRQVLINILTNAVKYNKPNGRIDFSIVELMSDENTITYQFIVSDTGIGMSDEFQTHMFDAFDQENTQVKSKYQGSGLGLSIVKRIVEQMGGNIDVESKKGMGSKFIVTITFDIADSVVEENTSQEVDEDKDVDIAGLKILLVEDNELNMEIASFLLEERGVELCVANDGQIAVEVFSKSEINELDVILMDVQMPNMDGLEATRTIRRMNRDDAKTIPIFAMTANAFEDDVRNCIAAGMNEHISKPLDMDKVVKTIAKYVRKNPI